MSAARGSPAESGERGPGPALRLLPEGGGQPITTAPAAAPANVLIVDDRSENLLSLEAVLEPLGHNIVRALSGQEALRQLLLRDFAVALIDVQMPDLDGFETARYMKRLERTRYVPIIFLTAHYSDASHVFRGYDVGAVDYLTKPFDPLVIRSKVQVFVDLSQKTAALERARLEQHHARQLEGLTEASLEIAKARTVERAVELCERWARDIVGAERSHVTLFGGAGGSRTRGPGGAMGTHEGGGGSELAAALTSVEGRSLGMIQLSGKRGEFGDGDQAILNQLARIASAALDGLRLYQHERGIADTLQRSLLPQRLPEIAGMSLGASYEAGGPGVEVGGDWYDAIELGPGRAGVALGDVMGKGLQAAVVMGQLRTALRAYVLEGHGPAAAMTRVDRLVQALGLGPIATLAYVIFDRDAREIRFCCAGHPPPLVIPADGEPWFLDGGRSLPLGVMEEPEHEEAVARLEPGATLLLYTDGLVEERNGSLDAALDRLRDLSAAAPSDPDELCEHLVAALRDEDRADDVTLLALRSLPPGRHLELTTASDPSALGGLRERLRGWLVEAEVDDREVFEIVSAFGEACTNAIEHAVNGHDAPIKIEATLVEDLLTVTVWNSGGWRAPRGGDRGRGLPLMEALMDSVRVLPGPKGTEVRLRRRLGA